MKLKYTFASVNLGDEYAYVPVGDSAMQLKGILRLNDEAFEIINLLEKDFTKEQIVDTLSAKYENNRVELDNFVQKTIEKLHSYGVIEE